MTHEAKLDEKALQASMDATLDWMQGTHPSFPMSRKERASFKKDNREEFVVTITAYLKALKPSTTAQEGK